MDHDTILAVGHPEKLFVRRLPCSKISRQLERGSQGCGQRPERRIIWSSRLPNSAWRSDVSSPLRGVKISRSIPVLAVHGRGECKAMFCPLHDGPTQANPSHLPACFCRLHPSGHATRSLADQYGARSIPLRGLRPISMQRIEKDSDVKRAKQMTKKCNRPDRIFL